MGVPVESLNAFILSDRRKRWFFICSSCFAGRVGKSVIFAGGKGELEGLLLRQRRDALSVRGHVVRRVKV